MDGVEMIRASDEFKAMLGMAERTTKSILLRDNLSGLQKAYYGDVWELLHRLACMIMIEGDSDYIELKTHDEIDREIIENEQTQDKKDGQ